MTGSVQGYIKYPVHADLAHRRDLVMGDRWRARWLALDKPTKLVLTGLGLRPSCTSIRSSAQNRESVPNTRINIKNACTPSFRWTIIRCWPRSRSTRKGALPIRPSAVRHISMIEIV